jgi:hypothetical protein
MRKREFIACALAVLLAGCTNSAQAENKSVNQEGSFGNLQAVAERILNENPVMLLSREYYPVELPSDEATALLAAMAFDKWEVIDSNETGIPSVSSDGFSLYSSEGDTPIEIWVDYDSSTAKATLYSSVSKVMWPTPAYMSSDDIKESIKYAVPKEVLSSLKSFDERVKMLYPYPRVTSFDSLQAIAEELVHDHGEGGRLYKNTGEAGSVVTISEATAGGLLSTLRLGEWVPKGEVQDIRSESSPTEGSDFEIGRGGLGESDFKIVFYSSSNTVKVLRTVFDTSVTWTGGPEIFEAREYSMPSGVMEDLQSFYDSQFAV